MCDGCADRHRALFGASAPSGTAVAPQGAPAPVPTTSLKSATPSSSLGEVARTLQKVVTVTANPEEGSVGHGGEANGGVDGGGLRGLSLLSRRGGAETVPTRARSAMRPSAGGGGERELTVVLEIPNDQSVNWLIGPDGKTITALQDESGTHICVQKVECVFFGAFCVDIVCSASRAAPRLLSPRAAVVVGVARRP